MIFDQYYEQIQQKKPFIGSLYNASGLVDKPSDWDALSWSWDHAMTFLDTHPAELIDRNDIKQRYFLKQAHQRASSPAWSKEIVSFMQQIFYQNTITNIVFLGIGPDTDSYPYHADKMDVFLVQALGNIGLKIEGFMGEKVIPFSPNSIAYIPRGTHHQIIPYESRCTFSFGVELEPDPSTYVLP